MQQLLEYRARLLERISAAAQEFRRACEVAQNPMAPLEEGGWSVHQLAVHTRDVQKQVYGMRLRRTVEEQNPEFQNFDADEWMAGHYDANEPIAAVLDELSASVAEQVEWLRRLPPEAWSRESRHAVMGGGFTTQTWAERALAHIEEHLETVKRGRG